MSAAPGQAGGCSGNRGLETRNGAADGEEADDAREALQERVESVETAPEAVMAIEDGRPFEPASPRYRVTAKRPAEGLVQRRRSVSPRVAEAGSEARAT